MWQQSQRRNGLRACISPALADGAACRFSLPSDGGAACRIQIRRLIGGAPPPAFRRVSRIDILHMGCLQALDALQRSRGLRGVAETLFGADTMGSTAAVGSCPWPPSHGEVL
jgi:hypothetical protein